MNWLRNTSVNDWLLVAGIVTLVALMSNLVTFSSNMAMTIENECNLFYGPLGSVSTQECVVEMSRRHYLPTRDQSTLTPIPQGR